MTDFTEKPHSVCDATNEPQSNTTEGTHGWVTGVEQQGKGKGPDCKLRATRPLELFLRQLSQKFKAKIPQANSYMIDSSHDICTEAYNELVEEWKLQGYWADHWRELPGPNLEDEFRSRTESFFPYQGLPAFHGKDSSTVGQNWATYSPAYRTDRVRARRPVCNRRSPTRQRQKCGWNSKRTALHNVNEEGDTDGSTEHAGMNKEAEAQPHTPPNKNGAGLAIHHNFKIPPTFITRSEHKVSRGDFGGGGGGGGGEAAYASRLQPSDEPQRSGEKQQDEVFASHASTAMSVDCESGEDAIIEMSPTQMLSDQYDD